MILPKVLQKGDYLESVPEGTIKIVGYDFSPCGLTRPEGVGGYG